MLFTLLSGQQINSPFLFFVIREFYRAYNERKRYLYDILEEKEMMELVYALLTVVAFVVVNVIWYVNRTKEYNEYVASCNAKL